MNDDPQFRVKIYRALIPVERSDEYLLAVDDKHFGMQGRFLILYATRFVSGYAGVGTQFIQVGTHFEHWFSDWHISGVTDRVIIGRQ